MVEWILTMWIEGNKTSEPDITGRGYPTAEACMMAGDLMKAADIAAKGIEKRYTINCLEVEKPLK